MNLRRGLLLRALTRAVSRAWIVLPILALFYSVEFQKYRPYDIDNAWFLSFSYNLCNEHIQTDEFWQVRFPSGMDGTHLFGKLAAYSQCAVLDRVGWLPRAASILTVAFTIASLGLWWAALRRMGYRSTFVGYFILLLGFSNVLLGMAEVFRYEFFSFFLLSLALWLTTMRQQFFALFLAFLVIETQPAALAVLLAITILLFAQTVSARKLVVQASAAALAACTIYLLLHPHGVQGLMRASRSGEPYIPGAMLETYYIKHPRHLFELAVLLLGGLLFWIHAAKIKRSEVGAIAFGMSLFVLFFPHPNTYYLVFALPFWLLAALLGYEQVPGFAWLPIAMTGLMLAEDAFRFKVNLHDGYNTSEIARVTSLIRMGEIQLGLDDENVQVVGERTLWYAHPRHYLSASAKSPGADRGDLYVCYQEALDTHSSDNNEQVTCGQLRKRITLVPVSQINLKGQTLSLYRRAPIFQGSSLR